MKVAVRFRLALDEGLTAAVGVADDELDPAWAGPQAADKAQSATKMVASRRTLFIPAPPLEMCGYDRPTVAAVRRAKQLP